MRVIDHDRGGPFRGRARPPVLAGDDAAFATFFGAYFPRLYRFALNRVDADPVMAKDVVQAALCRAVSRLSSYRGEAALFTWL